jgi:hypothetical protein
MIRFVLLTFLPALLLPIVSAQSDGYTGYDLKLEGRQDGSVLYETDDTLTTTVTTTTPPDVYLNASVSVGEIDLTVSNLTAQINLAASVLSLLQFNAGVDVSIDRVNLLIQNVSAKVLLEARLENLVLMINDTLNSLDLNPILATVTQDVGTLADTAVGGLTQSASALQARNYDIVNNILYSVNDYSGNTHTNRVLTQTGSIVDESVNNNGQVTTSKTVGTYLTDMTFNGYNVSTTRNGEPAFELEYVYTPFSGLSVISAIYLNAAHQVVGTQVLAESGAGGSSTVGDGEV